MPLFTIQPFQLNRGLVLEQLVAAAVQYLLQFLARPVLVAARLVDDAEIIVRVVQSGRERQRFLEFSKGGVEIVGPSAVGGVTGRAARR